MLRAVARRSPWPPATPARARNARVSFFPTMGESPMSRRFALLLSALLFVAVPAHAAKKVLFDNAHAETAGNADWIVDNDQPIPSPAQSGITSGTGEGYWTGAVSAG